MAAYIRAGTEHFLVGVFIGIPSVNMNIKIALVLLIIVVEIQLAIIISETYGFRAYFLPPTGPIADHLAKADHAWNAQAETDVLDDLFPPGTRLPLGAKGPRGDLKRALQQARFNCSTFRPTETGAGLQTCRNDAAGYTDEGCRRDWLILIELPAQRVGVSGISRLRAFVRAICWSKN